MSDSIHHQPLADQSGRNARRGFEYQDHIGARYCLQMLTNPALLEVWLESHDDITLVWDIGDGIVVYEFIQVKFIERNWLLSSVINRENGKDGKPRPGTALLEKSLAHNQYQETARFRLVTSREACSELVGLRFPLASPERLAAKSGLDQTATKIKAYYKKQPSPPAEADLDYWLDNCVWETCESTLLGLEALNLITLEKALRLQGFGIYPEYRINLYGLLLRKVADASIKDPYTNRDAFKIKRQECIAWLCDTAIEVSHGPDPKDKLGSKLHEIGVPTPGIALAREAKLLYNSERRDNDFCEPKDLRAMEAEILGRVSALQRKQYNPRTEQPPLDFYDACLTTAVDVLHQQRFVDDDGITIIPSSLAEGYVYEIVDRCLLRFKNPIQ
ncbi:dsDNA nuclease domain-containing protein [Hymenobacter terrenus]|uniref:dsDNA nuclease domain-containing protein n=1 Tax=Hymenobacter terrenus TaxID=1629124 RepID=UPI000619083F|nr:dsDNA nuclease domain-containing protein [Hymenobacter terrenus]